MIRSSTRASCASGAPQAETLFDVPVPAQRRPAEPAPAAPRPSAAAAAKASRSGSRPRRRRRSRRRRRRTSRSSRCWPAWRRSAPACWTGSTHAAGGRLRARRSAADRGRAGHRQDPDADPPDRVPLRGAGRLPGAVPGDHVHPAGRRGAAATASTACSAPVAEDVTVATFHALGLPILRENAGAAGLPADFRIADDAERAAARDRGRRRRRAAYAALLRKQDLVDLDELVTLPVELLRADPDAGRAVPGALAVDLRRRVPGRRRDAVRAAAAAQPGRTATSARSATRTRRSTRSAAPTSATSCASPRTSPTPGWSG